MSFQEVVGNKNWKDVIDEEIKAIKKNDTWELASLPKGNKAIDVKWVYKAKKNVKGEFERYKARLVAKVIAKEPTSTMMKFLLLVLR